MNQILPTLENGRGNGGNDDWIDSFYSLYDYGHDIHVHMTSYDEFEDNFQKCNLRIHVIIVRVINWTGGGGMNPVLQ